MNKHEQVEAHNLDIVVITGMSGSGKSVALRALEDAGYYCMDNLPPELLDHVRQLDISRLGHRVAIVIDVRSADALPRVPQQLTALREQGVTVRSLFLDANDATLIHRFSETRRRHPLSSPDAQHQQRALMEAIALERELLAPMREQSHVIDTSTIRSSKLQSTINDLIAASPHRLNLVFESFAFKRGIPVDADYVFDVRMLPNPHYDPALRDLTGLDAPVAQFLQQDAQAQTMLTHIASFLEHWLPALAQNHRSYVTVAIGCTGGQHRSVYLVEQLTARFASEWVTLKRHREVG